MNEEDIIDYPCSDLYKEAILSIKASGVDYPASTVFIEDALQVKLKKYLLDLIEVQNDKSC
jgi:hypothetical protein